MSETLVQAALATMLADTPFWGASGLMPVTLEPGDPASRLVLATGPNACGKSFACRYLAHQIATLREEREGIAVGNFFHIGMRLRTSGNGVFGPKSAVYGSEEEDSTGATSVSAVNWVQREVDGGVGRFTVAYDEAEIGLSDELAMALGIKIRGFAASPPDLCDAVIVVSHNRAFVSQLLDLNPHRLRFGPLSTAAWLANPPVPATLEELDGLDARNLETWRAINRLLEGRRAKKTRARSGK